MSSLRRLELEESYRKIADTDGVVNMAYDENEAKDVNQNTKEKNGKNLLDA